jgi:hypothetical protein
MCKFKITCFNKNDSYVELAKLIHDDHDHNAWNPVTDLPPRNSNEICILFKRG